MPSVVFDGFRVQAPRGWADITDSVEADKPPFTLADRNGVGALQFSIALYTGGPIPNPKPSELQKMVEEFGRVRGLDALSEVVVETGPPILAAASFNWDGDFVHVWQVSDGRNFAFITYTCSASYAGKEQAACERIVRSISFG